MEENRLGKDNMAKQFLSQNRRANLGRGQQNYYKYMDIMQSSLNQNIHENITPYWRNH